MEQIYLERNAALCRDLESGNFTQGRCALHIIVPGGVDTWCCLGVGSHRAVSDGVPIRREVRDGQEYFNDQTCLPPQAVADYYGWPSVNPSLLAENGRWVLAGRLNDVGDYTSETPYTFGQIAAAFRRSFGIPADS